MHEVFPKAGKPLSGNNDFWIRLTPESFFPGFANALIGAKPDETREVEIEVPQDFAVEEMRGQKIQYAVAVKAAKRKQLAEIDDAFASKVVAGKTAADLRELAKDELRRQKESQTAGDKRAQIMAHLLSKVECELPENMVRGETRRLLAEIVKENQSRGVTEEVIRENQNDLLASAGQSARERLKGSFILLRIAETEKNQRHARRVPKPHRGHGRALRDGV